MRPLRTMIGAVFGFGLAACGGGGSSGGSATATVVQITAQPQSQTVVTGQTATFSVTATGISPLSYQWQRNDTDIAGASSASYSTGAVNGSDNDASYRVVVSNADGSATSHAAILSVANSLTDVLTFHDDPMRTGQNLTETILTPSNVGSAHFGKLFALTADGLVDAQPLVVSGLNIHGTTRNVVYVATEHDSVYAYDMDSAAQLAKVSLLGGGETASDARNCNQVSPEIGITATPVIDRSAGPNGTLYVTAMSKDANGSYFQRLHALDLVTLADRIAPQLIQATYPGSGTNSANGQLSFDAKQYKERAALLLLGGQVYTTWASHCDIAPYNGWIMAYDENSLVQTRVLNVTPNGTEGSIWHTGGLAADAAGAIYAIAGNGSFDTMLDGNGLPSKQDYGNAAIKATVVSGALSVTDYFTMSNTVAESSADQDLGSGSPLLLPDQTDSAGTVWHLMAVAGKDGNLYVLNRDRLGHYHVGGNQIYQELDNAFDQGGLYSSPAYFNGTVYFADVGGTLKAYALANARFPASPTSQSPGTFAYPGASPTISANGLGNAIIWAVESSPGGTAVLHAYNPANLAEEYYNSTQASGNRDAVGNSNKFITPVIANGKVLVGTPNGVTVFGLIN